MSGGVPSFTYCSLFTRGQPHADQDLLVHRVSIGQQVATSTSHGNTYQIVEVTAPASGEYSLRQSMTCPAGAVIPFGVGVHG